MQQIEEGGDPAKEKLAAKRAPAPAAPKIQTYAEVVDAFIEKYAKPRQRTWSETRRVLLRNCAAWADRPIGEITRTDAYALLDGFIAEGHGPKARVTRAWLVKLWRWAAQREIVSAAIMDSVQIEVEPRIRARHYSTDEIRALWDGAEALPVIQRGYLKLVLLLGVRKNELAKMRRSELDDPENPTVWVIPHERTKTKKSTQARRTYVVPLPPLAQRILKRLPVIGDDEAARDIVFPGRHHGKPLDPGSPLARQIQKESGVADFYFHACRDTIATWLENEGASDYERKLVLNHEGTSGATRNYSHGVPIKLKRELLEKWARHVDEAVTGEGVRLLS